MKQVESLELVVSGMLELVVSAMFVGSSLEFNGSEPAFISSKSV